MENNLVVVYHPICVD